MQPPCKLCLQNKPLQESHLIPAAVYKRFYSPSHPNPNPMLISSRGVIQTSRQTKTHLLCNECEDVLNRNGEKWVLPRIANVDKSFPLFDMLTKVSPDCVLPNISAYSASRNQEINVAALTHFAMGIFWKASVHHWQGRDNTPQISLGPYSEELRKFVLDPSGNAFPEHVTLMIALLLPSNVPLLTNIPVRGPSGDGFRNFKFYIPGVQFILSVGKTVSYEVCFHNNPLHPICVQDLRKDVERSPMRLMNEARRAKR
jgi:hypothetical protein